MTKIKKECLKCNGVEFYKSGKCKACTMKASAEFYLLNSGKLKAESIARRVANPEHIRAIDAKWKKANSEKLKADRAIRYASNPEKAKLATRAWNAANPGKSAAQTAAYRVKNPKKVKDACRAWVAANPEAARIHKQNRRARTIENGGILTKGLVAKLFKLQRGQCACCKQSLGKNYHLDHVLPVSLGGPNTDDNMQLLRAVCNLQKHAKHPVDFMQSRGFLL